MKVFVISLTRAPERRKFMISQLERLKLDYEIVDAVDFMEMTEEDFNTKVDQNAVAKDIKYFTKGLQACSLSHIKTYEKIALEDLTHALILEDDAVIPHNINELLNDITPQLKDNEIISLSYYHRWENCISLSNKHNTNISGENSLYYPTNLHHLGSAMAYVISKNAAINMAKSNFPVKIIVDHWGKHYDNGGFDSFRCLYPQQLLPAPFNSMIDYPNSNRILNMISQYIRKYKIPILYSLLLKKDKSSLNFKYNIVLVNEPPYLEDNLH